MSSVSCPRGGSDGGWSFANWAGAFGNRRILSHRICLPIPPPSYAQSRIAPGKAVPGMSPHGFDYERGVPTLRRPAAALKPRVAISDRRGGFRQPSSALASKATFRHRARTSIRPPQKSLPFDQIDTLQFDASNLALSTFSGRCSGLSKKPARRS